MRKFHAVFFNDSIYLHTNRYVVSAEARELDLVIMPQPAGTGLRFIVSDLQLSPLHAFPERISG
jgi:hypothetical protein